jgi:hypothetical protein
MLPLQTGRQHQPGEENPLQFGLILSTVSTRYDDRTQANIAQEIVRRLGLAGDEVPSSLEGLVERHLRQNDSSRCGWRKSRMGSTVFDPRAAKHAIARQPLGLTLDGDDRATDEETAPAPGRYTRAVLSQARRRRLQAPTLRACTASPVRSVLITSPIFH